MPKVSIISPVFNVENYIDEFMESVLSQTFTDFELILIDDGSTDLSFERCKKYITDSRIKLFRQENKGAAGARNMGLSVASGDWISFVDPDDCIAPDFLQVILEDSQSEDGIDLVQCYTERFDDSGKIFDYKPFYKRNSVLKNTVWLAEAEYYFTRNKILPRTVLYSAEIIRKHNLFFMKSILSVKIVILRSGMPNICKKLMLMRESFIITGRGKNP